MIPAAEALQRLKEGNRRYLNGVSHLKTADGHPAGLEQGQAPFAVILACADSRVPVEMIFDQGPGDLFVTRVAGNIAAPSQLGSIEFAATQLGSKLVVVLGHSNCGAVDATLKTLATGQDDLSPNLLAIIDRIRPAVEPLENPSLHEAVAANVRCATEQLRHGSAILEQLITSGDLTVVGAEYSIENGAVEFFDD
ncbi:MAG TPA: carbonic anhydrase [Woeseiaceae bacterium]|jgi:carbonic anhydrase|nr:carbonic anhydrase [Woeseiaceae bacterium]